MKQQLKERFESKFRVTPGCWTWAASTSNFGYGWFKLNGRMHNAHRVSYALYVGEIPNNTFICHRCDNPKCVNPDHLFIGTSSDNSKDRNSKNRQFETKGSSNGRSKLSDQDIPKIVSDPRPKMVIAKEYGVSRQLISRVKLGQCWRHLS